MAEMIAISLAAKVAAALSRTAALGLSSLVAPLVAVRSGIADAAHELELLSAFLRYADSRRPTDALVEAWVAQVRGAAFELEDVADEYSLLSGRGFLQDCKHLKAWYALAKRLRKARERLRDLSAAREQYGIRPAEAGEPSAARGAAAGRRVAEAAHFVEEAELVGFAAHRRLLMEWLTQDGEPRRKLIAVWGMGGVGKTTLATRVYKDAVACGRFDCTAWVAVSQGFTTDDLLRRILKELHRDASSGMPWDVDEMDYRALVEAVREHFEQKRYLVMLDDVWHADAWFQIRNALLDDETGSRVLITTRSRDVASLAVSARILMLEPLPKDEAWPLFCNTAFKEEADRKCPPHLEFWAVKILDKCQGLPLAIVSVGNVLALKEPVEFAWKNVHDSLVWDEGGDVGIGRVSSILNLSINDLPYRLKKCFLYCSIYPEDFLIKRKILIRSWVAEGFVEERAQCTMEEVADDYLNQLVGRSLLQVAMSNEFGRVKRCRIHDLTRELIVHKSTEDRFFHLSKCTTSLQLDNRIRHLTFDRCEGDYQSAVKMPSLRCLHVFGSKLDLDTSLFSGFRLLTVLNLWFMEIKKLPTAVVHLLNLRYLGIRSTLIEELPKELGRLHNLQTLDAKWSMVQKLPSSIAELTNLRHLIVLRRQGDLRHPIRGFPFAFGLLKGIQSLSCLQTLKYVRADKQMVRSLGSMAQLRSLDLFGVDESHLSELSSSISRLSCLVRLGINSEDINVTLDLESISPAPLKLQKITLRGKLKGGNLPLWFGSLHNLTHLRLHASGLVDDSIRLLSSLPRLLNLSLLSAYTERSLIFPAGCFPVLKTLSLLDLANLTSIEFQKEGLTSLQELTLERCAQLSTMPQGIANLTRLQRLELFDIPSELIDKLQEGEGDGEQVRRIPVVKNLYQKRGRYLKERLHIDLLTIQR